MRFELVAGEIFLAGGLYPGGLYLADLGAPDDEDEFDGPADSAEAKVTVAVEVMVVVAGGVGEDLGFLMALVPSLGRELVECLPEEVALEGALREGGFGSVLVEDISISLSFLCFSKVSSESESKLDRLDLLLAPPMAKAESKLPFQLNRSSSNPPLDDE